MNRIDEIASEYKKLREERDKIAVRLSELNEEICSLTGVSRRELFSGNQYLEGYRYQVTAQYYPNRSITYKEAKGFCKKHRHELSDIFTVRVTPSLRKEEKLSPSERKELNSLISLTPRYPNVRIKEIED